MAKNSSIEWTHHTFNPWWGCTKVSQACKFCYAETWAKRVGVDVWGSRAPRRVFSDQHWREPLRWNAEAAREGARRRVFCASMADVFEDRRELELQRERLWQVIQDTAWLDWLLLTKRPGNVGRMVPWKDRWPANVWLGTTVEDQKCAEHRIPLLVRQPAACRFLSCEPLLGPVDLSSWLRRTKRRCTAPLQRTSARTDQYIDWIIAGGESGPKARPMHPDWARSLRDQCSTSGTAFHFKQWGHWSPLEAGNNSVRQQLVLESADGAAVVLGKMGKKAAGRQLDGRTWDEFPILAASA